MARAAPNKVSVPDLLKGLNKIETMVRGAEKVK
jgi:hypothetical protein